MWPHLSNLNLTETVSLSTAVSGGVFRNALRQKLDSGDRGGEVWKTECGVRVRAEQHPADRAPDVNMHQ